MTYYDQKIKDDDDDDDVVLFVSRQYLVLKTIE